MLWRSQEKKSSQLKQILILVRVTGDAKRKRKKMEVLVVVGVDSYFRQRDQGRPLQRGAFKLRPDG